jgi:2-polyprenyl-3-methyl-5-hydroxy-6-metoxy-1,4-benzoquinol methylase
MSATQASRVTEQNADVIRSRSCPYCCVCGQKGESLYENLSDRLFGAPGMWNLKRCPSRVCGVVWLDPMPVEEDIGKAYRSYYTHEADAHPANNLARRLYSRIRAGYVRVKYGYRNDKRNRWDQLFALLANLNPVRRASFDFGVFYLRFNPNGRFLELGCGSGLMLESMRDLGWRAEGIDFDASAVELTSKKNLVVHCGKLQDLEFADETFDAIAAIHFIEHVSDPLGVLRECRRLLKPGGRLVLITPNADSWGHRYYRADWRGLEPPRHLHIFTPRSIAELCRKTGFNYVVSRSTVRASGIHLASRALRRRGNCDSLRRVGWLTRAWDELRCMFQWAGTFVDSDAGDEVLLIAGR